MAVYLFILLAVCCYGMKFSSFHQDYLSLSTTRALKGVFAIIILFSHVRLFADIGPGLPDRMYGFTMRYLGQLMVAAYFFYSGFGITESSKRKENYVKGFFRKRILKILLYYDLALFLFLVLQTLTGHFYDTRFYLFCWFAWNSSWFVFDILALYFITYLALILKERFHLSQVFFACFVSLCTIALWVFVAHEKRPDYWWYDTLAVFPAGIWYSIIKEKVDTISLKGRLLLVLLLVACFVLWRHFIGIDDYGICAIIFTLALTAVTCFVKIDNPVLQWLGKYSFFIIILHRIPMNAFSQTSLVNSPLVFTGIVLVTSLLLAWGFGLLMRKIDTVLFT